MTYVIYRCPECGTQARHYDPPICQHFDPEERYVPMEQIQVVEQGVATDARRLMARAYGSLGKINLDNARVRDAEKNLEEAMQIFNKAIGDV